jgi:uncharacterized protein (UPF0332 family)
MTMEHSEEFVKASLHRAEKALRSSKLLFENDELEDAVSRAYYAMYHATRALLFSKGKIIKTHTGLLTLFGEHIVKRKVLDKEFAVVLRKAFNLRQKSDYELYAELSKESVEEVITDAEKFISKIKEVLSKTTTK